jgi:hypothetical protein
MKSALERIRSKLMEGRVVQAHQGVKGDATCPLESMLYMYM